MARNSFEGKERKWIERNCCIHLTLVYSVQFSNGAPFFSLLFFVRKQSVLWNSEVFNVYSLRTDWVLFMPLLLQDNIDFQSRWSRAVWISHTVLPRLNKEIKQMLLNSFLWSILYLVTVWVILIMCSLPYCFGQSSKDQSWDLIFRKIHLLSFLLYYQCLQVQTTLQVTFLLLSNFKNFHQSSCSFLFLSRQTPCT